MRRRQVPLNILERVIMWVGGVGLLVGVGVMFFGVVFRYFFQGVITWSWEVTVGVVVCGLLLTAGAVTRKEAHTRVDVLVERFHGRGREIFELLLSVASAVAFAFLCYAGVMLLKELKSLGIMMPSRTAPQWVYFLPFPIGMGACALYSIERIYEHARALTKPEQKVPLMKAPEEI